MRRRERKQKGAVYIALFIAFIMITSVIGYMYGNNTETTLTERYNGFLFTKNQDAWVTTIDDTEMQFTFHPLEVEQITFASDAKQLLLNKKESLFITYDPDEITKDQFAIAQYALIDALRKQGIDAKPALTKPNAYSLPVAICDTKQTTILLTTNNTFSQEDAIFLKENCIIAKGDALHIRDRMSYELFGVIAS